jgi:hypothetical protein
MSGDEIAVAAGFAWLAAIVLEFARKPFARGHVARAPKVFKKRVLKVSLSFEKISGLDS